MSYAEFFKVRFNGLDLFILHTTDAYTYIKTGICYPHLHFLLFHIRSKWFMHTFSTNYDTIVDFWCLDTQF